MAVGAGLIAVEPDVQLKDCCRVPPHSLATMLLQSCNGMLSNKGMHAEAAAVAFALQPSARAVLNQCSAGMRKEVPHLSWLSSRGCSVLCVSSGAPAGGLHSAGGSSEQLLLETGEKSCCLCKLQVETPPQALSAKHPAAVCRPCCMSFPR